MSHFFQWLQTWMVFFPFFLSLLASKIFFFQMLSVKKESLSYCLIEYSSSSVNCTLLKVIKSLHSSRMLSMPFQVIWLANKSLSRSTTNCPKILHDLSQRFTINFRCLPLNTLMLNQPNFAQHNFYVLSSGYRLSKQIFTAVGYTLFFTDPTSTKKNYTLQNHRPNSPNMQNNPKLCDFVCRGG